MKLTDENTGEAFKEALVNLELAPPKSVWKAIYAINKAKGIIKPFSSLAIGIYVAASILVGGAILYFALSKSASVPSKISATSKITIPHYTINSSNKGMHQKATSDTILLSEKSADSFHRNDNETYPIAKVKHVANIHQNKSKGKVFEENKRSISQIKGAKVIQLNSVPIVKIRKIDSLLQDVKVERDNFSIKGSISNSQDSLVVKYGADKTICFGEKVSLAAEEGYYYRWSTGENTASIEVSPSENTFYDLTVSNEKGQESTHRYKVSVDKNCTAVFIPSAFTPNGDGKNDIFKAEGRGIREFNLLLMNSMGQIVFEANTIDQAWDGRYKGNLLPAATYFYIAKYKDARLNKHIKKGQVTLIR